MGVIWATYWNAFSRVKTFAFWFKLHWNLFTMDLIEISQHGLRWWFGAKQAWNHYMNQWWPISLALYNITTNKIATKPCVQFTKYIVCTQDNKIVCDHWKFLLIIVNSIWSISYQLQGTFPILHPITRTRYGMHLRNVSCNSNKTQKVISDRLGMWYSFQDFVAGNFVPRLSYHCGSWKY